MNNKVQFVGIVACVPKGDWQSNLTYDLLNIVRHNNASWVATTTVPANNEPLEGSQYWNLLVKDGENGSGGSAITIDDALSLTSTNPVQNKVIALALNDKQAQLISGVNIKTINNQPLLGEGNLEIEGGSGITVDTELSDTSTNPVENQAITKALDEKINMPPSVANKRVVVLTAGNGAVEGIAVQISANSGTFGNIPTYWNPVFDNADQEASSVMGMLTTKSPTKSLHCVNLDYFNRNKGTKFWQHTISFSGPGYYYPIIAITLSDTQFTVNANNHIELPNVGDGSDTDRLKNLVACYVKPIAFGNDVRVKIAQNNGEDYLTLQGFTSYGDFVDTVTEL